MVAACIVHATSFMLTCMALVLSFLHRFTIFLSPSQEYQKAKDAIIRYERDILRVFGFIVHCDHPHKLLISFVQFLRGDGDLMQEAWNVVNDRCAGVIGH